MSIQDDSGAPYHLEQRRSQRRAFSLAEFVSVAVIIGILAAIAAPRFSNSLALQRVEAAARRIVVDLALAQRHARSASTDQTVRFEPASHEYCLAGMPHPNHPGWEYSVSLAKEPYGTVLVSADFGGDTEIVYDIYGRPDSGGAANIRVGVHDRTITVDAETGLASISE